jgi:hypothetical protein
MITKTYRFNPKNPLVVLASILILVGSVVVAFLATAAMVILSCVLHPILTKLGRRGMWRQNERGKLILALDAEAFQRATP